MRWPFRSTSPPSPVAGSNDVTVSRSSETAGADGGTGSPPAGSADGWSADSGAVGGGDSAANGWDSAAGGGVFGGVGVRAGWEELPPLQRSTEDLAPIAPAASFRESLSAHQDPRFLAPLGHSLTVDAPAGEISNYAQPAPVEQRQEFALPPSVANFGTAGDGAGASVQRTAEEFAPVQRAVEGNSEPVRTFSLPSAQVPAGQLPSIEPRPTPVVQTWSASAGSSSASELPVVSRAVESHHDHIHSSSEDVAPQQESVEQVPLVGSAEAIGQSPFVSALGGPQDESGPDAVHRSESGSEMVQRSAGSDAAAPESVGPLVRRSAEVGPVVQRAAEVGPVAQRVGDLGVAVQRAAEVGPVIQRVARSAELTQHGSGPGGGSGQGAESGEGARNVQAVQRDVDGRAGAEGGAQLPVSVQRAGREQRGEAAGSVVQRAGQETEQVDLVANRVAELGPVAQRALDAQAVAQRAVEGEQPQWSGDVQSESEPASRGSGLTSGSVGDLPMAQRLSERQGVVQRAEESPVGLPVGGGASVSRVEFPVQRVADEQRESPQVELLANRVGELGPVAQRALEVQGGVGRGAAELPVAQRPLAGELAVPAAGSFEGSDVAQGGPGSGESVAAVQRSESGAGVELPGLAVVHRSGGAHPAPAGGIEQLTVLGEVGLVGGRGLGVQRAVESGQQGESGGQSVQRLGGGAAELLWPPPAGAVADAVVPLSSAAPLTVPGVQQTFNTASVPPAVQRVVYDHPELRTPGSGRQATTPRAQTSAVQVPQVQVEEQVLSWSAGESFHAEPAVQRAETESVKAVSLQQMFGGYQAPASAEDVVQRDEAPVEAAPAPAPVVQAAAPAQAVAPAKAVSAAEVEELAKRLYEPLTAKLRAELWLDRERAGRVTDRWH